MILLVGSLKQTIFTHGLFGFKATGILLSYHYQLYRSSFMLCPNSWYFWPTRVRSGPIFLNPSNLHGINVFGHLTLTFWGWL